MYANYTLMDVKQDNSDARRTQLALIANDARTSVHKLNAGVQLRTKLGFDGEVDFHYVSPQDWAEQVTDVAEAADRVPVVPPLRLHAPQRARRLPLLRGPRRGQRVAFNLLDDQHREHPVRADLGRRVMGFLTYRF